VSAQFTPLNWFVAADAAGTGPAVTSPAAASAQAAMSVARPSTGRVGRRSAVCNNTVLSFLSVVGVAEIGSGNEGDLLFAGAVQFEDDELVGGRGEGRPGHVQGSLRAA
jgi:hypothetical protein